MTSGILSLLLCFAFAFCSCFLLVDLGKDSGFNSLVLFCGIINAIQCKVMSLTRCHGTGGTLLRRTWWESHQTRENVHVSFTMPLPRLSHDIHTWGISTRSPTATPMAMRLPSRSRPPGPTARTLASLSFSTLDSGRKMPLAVLASALTRWTSTRSRRGARARMERTVDCRFLR